MTLTVQGVLLSPSSKPVLWVSDKVDIVLGEDGTRNASDLVSRVRHMASRVWPCGGSG